MSMRNFCAIHFESININENVVSFTEKTFEKVCDYANKWIPFDCQQGNVARIFKSSSTFQNIGEIDDQLFGMHRKCYNRFTDKTRLERFEKRSLTEKLLIFTAPSASDEEPEPRKKRPRSSSNFDPSTSDADDRTTRSSVDTDKCIFCKRQRKDKRNRIDGRRTREPLQQCKSVNEILVAAKLKHDENLLCYLQRKDLVAAEIRYHQTCKLNYTNFLRYKKKTNIEPKHSVAYNIFKEDIIIKRIIKGNEVLRMSKLSELYSNIIMSVEGTSIIAKTQHLKQQILCDFPQLTFLKSKQRNQSEVVLCKNIVADLMAITVTIV